MAYSVDRRPLWIVVLRYFIRPAILLTALSFIILPSFIASPEGLDPRGFRVLGIFGACALLWASQAIPMGITGLSALALIVLLDIAEAKHVYSKFGSPSVFFLLGAFVLAAAAKHTGVVQRIALAILSPLPKRPRVIILTLGALGFFTSMILPEHAVAAMLFPVGMLFVQLAPPDADKSTFGALMVRTLAWGCVTGGIITLLGGARNPLAVAILMESNSVSISFVDWMIAAFPVGFVQMLLVLAFTWKPAGRLHFDMGEAQRVLERRIELAGPMSSQERVTLVIIVGTIFAWMRLGEQVGMATIALLGIALLFCFRSVRWRDLEVLVPWDVVLLYGGAISLGSLLQETGAIHWLGRKTFGGDMDPMLALIVLSIAAKVATEALSNSAVVAVFLPLALSLLAPTGVDPVAVTLAVALSSGLAYTLPISTPAIAMAYDTGYLTTKKQWGPGLFMNLVGLVSFWVVVYLWWPYIGISLP